MTLIPVLTTNGFGYDSATSCDPNASRKGRAAQLLQTIPCDLSVQAYCNLPGSAYPWHAVRRFVHENQGLMRRMYGDVRHISVLKAEIDNNDIDMDDIHRTAEKYSRTNAGKKVKFLHSPYHEYAREKSNDIITEPHFRPTQKTTTVKPETKIMKTSISPLSTTTATTTESAKFVQIKTTSKPTFLNVTLDNISTDVTEASVTQNKSKITMNTVNGSTIDIEKLSTIAILETNETLLGNVSLKESSKGVNKVSNLTTNAETNDTTVKDDSVAESTAPPVTPKVGVTAEGVVDSSKENMIITASEQVNTTTKETVKNTKNTSKPMESQLFQDAAQKEQPLAGVKGV